MGPLMVVATPLGASSQARSELTLNRASGPVNSPVTASQRVEPGACTTYRLRWDGGQLLVRASSQGGQVRVTFRVPQQASPGDHDVVATCQGGPFGGEVEVGRRNFRVVPIATTTVPPATSTPPTSTPPTSTAPTIPPGTGPPTTGGPPPTTSPTPTTIPTSVPPRVREECERVVREAQPKLHYQPELEMTVGKSYDVTAILPLAGAPPDTIPGPPTTVVKLPQIYCYVAARLTGLAEEFDISPDRNDWIQQSFTTTNVLTWTWRVSPRKPGSSLKLTVQLRSESPGADPGQVPNKDALINVSAAPKSLPSRLWELVSGFFGNPVVQYLLLPSGGGILTAWLVRRWRRTSGE